MPLAPSREESDRFDVAHRPSIERSGDRSHLTIGTVRTVQSRLRLNVGQPKPYASRAPCSRRCHRHRARNGYFSEAGELLELPPNFEPGAGEIVIIVAETQHAVRAKDPRRSDRQLVAKT